MRSAENGTRTSLPVPTHPIFQQYQERLGRRRAKESSLRNYARTATLFQESGLDPLTAEDWQIEEWLIGLPLADTTKQLHHDNLSATYRYAVLRHLLNVSPMETVRLPQRPDSEPRILSPETLRSILRASRTDQDMLLTHLLVYTGMRKTEVRTLRWEHVRFADSTLTVVSGKGDKLRHIPIHPRLSEVLVKSGRPGLHQTVVAGPSGTELSDKGIQHRLERLKGDCSFHDFRRTATSSLVKNGAPYDAIDRIMGWSPRTVRQRHYTNVAPDALQEAILRLYVDCPL